MSNLQNAPVAAMLVRDTAPPASVLLARCVGGDGAVSIYGSCDARLKGEVVGVADGLLCRQRHADELFVVPLIETAVGEGRVRSS